MNRAIDLIAWSKDHNTGVGAVIVDDRFSVADGYNGFPRGVVDTIPERHERPDKYLYVVHAELNAIITAGRQGKSVEGCTMYCTMFPCADCAGAIIQSGIRRLVTPKSESERWDDSHKAASQMFKEAGVQVDFWDGFIDRRSTYKKANP